MLGRDSTWRQGDLLTEEGERSLGTIIDIGPDNHVVLISHDCDIPNLAETFVEVIVGTRLDSIDPMRANARHPRSLHLTYLSSAGEKVSLELTHAERIQVAKEDFIQAGERNDVFCLPDNEKRALKQWLAARYGRPAFPNNFEQRLRKRVGRRTVELTIARILKPVSLHLVAVFFDLGEERDVELQENEPYYLSISIVYNSADGGVEARESAKRTAKEITLLFERAYGNGTDDTVNGIILDRCTEVADTYITLADLRKVDQWRLEYVSLSNEDDEFLTVGEIPA